MSLSELYKRIALISPYIEVGLRHLYWSNVGLLKKFNPNRPQRKEENTNFTIDFDRVIDWLKLRGIGKGDVLIVHSSYGALECTNLSPQQIIQKLLDLIGPAGTLCMPVIRRFKEEENAIKNGISLDDVKIKYNVKKTMVTSGMLPYELMQWEGAQISKFPYNPLCAVGPLAKEMMEHNLEGELPTPHGPNSSWKFCYDHGAKVCSIGTDIEHHNTIGHITEEAFGNWKWSSEEWYDIRNFIIIDENKESREIRVRNRKDKWGQLHLADINANTWLKGTGAMVSDVIENVIPVGFVNPQLMIEEYKKKNIKGYPYYVFPWQHI